MQFIHWGNQPRNHLAIDIIAPDSKIPGITLEKAVDKFLNDAPRLSKATSDYRSLMCKWVLKAMDPKKNIDTIKVSDMNDLLPGLKKLGLTKESKARGARSNLAAVIRFAKGNGIMTYNRGERSPDNVTLRMTTGKVDELPDILISRETGRFAPFKIEVKRLIPTIPADEYICIPATKTMISDKKERNAVVNAINTLFGPLLPWICTYSHVRNALVIVRRKQYDELKIKKRGKK